MYINYGDVCQVDFGHQCGSEQGKERPCVVVQNDFGNRYSPTTIVIPLTSEIKKTNLRVHDVLRKNKSNGLDSDSLILAEQVRVIDKSLILYKRGTLTDDEFDKVERAFLANLPRKSERRRNREKNRSQENE